MHKKNVTKYYFVANTLLTPINKIGIICSIALDRKLNLTCFRQVKNFFGIASLFFGSNVNCFRGDNFVIEGTREARRSEVLESARRTCDFYLLYSFDIVVILVYARETL